METQKWGMPMREVHRAVDGVDDPLDLGLGIAGIIGVAFLADAAGLGKVVEQDAVNEVLAFHVGGELDVVGEGFVDVEFVPEGLAESFAGGLRGGDGGVDHGSNVEGRSVEVRSKMHCRAL